MEAGSNLTVFEVRALADRSVRDAIGGVCIHWALLELTVERVLSNLQEGSGVLRYDAQLAENLKRLSELVNNSRKINSTQKQDLQNLIQQVREIREERHRVVHGLWGTDEKGVVHSIFPSIARKVAPTKPMTAEDIRDVKLRIVDLGKRFRAYVEPSAEVRIVWEKA